MMLVMHAGELVEKDELLKQIWPDTFVEEANLTQNVFLLRKLLGHERNGPKYIETVTRRGYRFVAEVKAVEQDQNRRADLTIQNTFSQPPVVAVLPFANNTGNNELEYLADGLTESLINNLSRVSKLRVMSRTTVFRFKGNGIDPQKVVKELGADVVLIGSLNVRNAGMAIAVELVDTSNGWQLWGESFDFQSQDILQVQEGITRQLLSALNLTLSGEEVNRATARYTENAAAYQSYLEGRYHWSQYTRKGIERAIGHFRNAIETDPNYALAYAGIVDCYLRLATNYLPPEDDLPAASGETTFPAPASSERADELDPKIKLRFEWDWKSAERELRRANELHSDYPSAHQWYAAYRVSKQLFEESKGLKSDLNRPPREVISQNNREPFPARIASIQLTSTEQLQVHCSIVREQIDSGNYEAACLVLRPWWSFGVWPKLHGLNSQSCADLLYTSGELAGWLASSKQLQRGQKHAEELLNGSIALFEQLGFTKRAAEGRIELALCYYRQGLFDIGRSTLIQVLSSLIDNDFELRGLALIRLASLERHAGRLKDALTRLLEARRFVEVSGPWGTGRCHLELASTYKDLASAENILAYFDYARFFYVKALRELEAVGHHRYVAVVENNVGFLLLSLGCYEESEKHLCRARKLFDSFSDLVRGAQVNETLARLYIQTKEYNLAHKVIERAVKTLAQTDGEALLSEALRTQGVLASRLGNYANAKRSLEAAYQVAARCGDKEGAGRALLLMLEEIGSHLEKTEKIEMAEVLQELLLTTQQTSVRARIKICLTDLAKMRADHESDRFGQQPQP